MEIRIAKQEQNENKNWIPEFSENTPPVIDAHGGRQLGFFPSIRPWASINSEKIFFKEAFSELTPMGDIKLLFCQYIYWFIAAKNDFWTSGFQSFHQKSCFFRWFNWNKSQNIKLKNLFF